MKFSRLATPFVEQIYARGKGTLTVAVILPRLGPPGSKSPAIAGDLGPAATFLIDLRAVVIMSGEAEQKI
jgi:hypothetical protein